jgi:hypothetical protein
MMLQNYTYVDPVMDPVVLLALLLGLVFLTAAVVVFFTIRSLPLSSATSASSTRDVSAAFIPAEAGSIVLMPRASVNAGSPDTPPSRAADRAPERRSSDRASRRIQAPA